MVSGVTRQYCAEGRLLYFVLLGNKYRQVYTEATSLDSRMIPPIQFTQPRNGLTASYKPSRGYSSTGVISVYNQNYMAAFIFPGPRSSRRTDSKASEDAF